MSKKQKKENGRSTRQLLGIRAVREDGLATDGGDLWLFRIQPVNLSMLPEEGVRERVLALQRALSLWDGLELLVLDDRESFEENKAFCQERLQKETLPAIRELLRQDRAHLDRIQDRIAASRAFYLLLRSHAQEAEAARHWDQAEQSLRQNGFTVHRAGEQELKRLLTLYFQQTDRIPCQDLDGDRWVILGE